jgi:hypothetical protein
LDITNLGTSGQNGVSIDVAGRIPNNFDFDIFTAGTQAGSARIDAFGIVNGQSNTLIGSELFNATNPNLVFATLSLNPIVAPLGILVKGFQNGVLAATTIVPEPAVSVVALGWWPIPKTWDFSCCFPPDVSIDGDFGGVSIPGFPNLVGSLNLFLEGIGGAGVNDITRIDILAALPDLMITNEIVEQRLGVPEPPIWGTIIFAIIFYAGLRRIRLRWHFGTGFRSEA